MLSGRQRRLRRSNAVFQVCDVASRFAGQTRELHEVKSVAGLETRTRTSADTVYENHAQRTSGRSDLAPTFPPAELDSWQCGGGRFSNGWMPCLHQRTSAALLSRLAPETVEQFILDQLDRAGLGHNTFTPEALALIVRSGEGLLRRTRNLCLGALIEAVRDQTRIVDLKQVNRVLIQPHWRKDCDQPIA